MQIIVSLIILSSLSSLLYSMDLPNAIHDLAKEYKDPVLVTGRNLNASWRMERAVAMQSNTFKNQNSDAHGAQVFYLTDNFTTQNAQLFCESLADAQHLIIQRTLPQCARLAEMADEMETPILLEHASKTLNAAFNMPAALKECLQKGHYDCKLNVETALRVGTANLQDNPSILWFWALKEHATNRSQEPQAVITFPLQKDLYFDYLHALSGNLILDHEGHVWDIPTQKIVRSLESRPLKCGIKNKLLACYKGYYERWHHTIAVLNDQLQEIKTICADEAKNLEAVALDPKGKYLAVSEAKNPDVILINSETQEIRNLKSTRIATINWLDFSNNGHKLLACHGVHIDVFDLALEKEKLITSIWKGSEDFPVYFFDYAAFNPTGTKILAMDCKAYIFDAVTANLEKTLTHLERGDVMGARYNHTGDLVVTTHPHDIWVWDAHMGTKLQRFENHSLGDIKRGPKSVTAIFSPDSQYIITAKNERGKGGSIIMHRIYAPETMRYLERGMAPEQVALLKHLREKILAGQSADIAAHPGIPSIMGLFNPEMQTMIKRSSSWTDNAHLLKHVVSKTLSATFKKHQP